MTSLEALEAAFNDAQNQPEVAKQPEPPMTSFDALEFAFNDAQAKGSMAKQEKIAELQKQKSPSMLGAVASGAWEGFKEGPLVNFSKNVVQSATSGLAATAPDLIFGQPAMSQEMKASDEEERARRLLGYSEYKLYGTAPKDAKSIAELDQRLPNWRNYETSRYLPPEEVKRLNELGFQLQETRRQGSAEYKEGMNRVKPNSFSEAEIAKDREEARMLRERASERSTSAEVLRGAQKGMTEDMTPEWAKLNPNDTSKSAWAGSAVGSAIPSLALAAAAGPLAGNLLLSSQQAMGEYDKAIKEGMSPIETASRVGASFLWASGSEWLPLEFMKSTKGAVRGAVTGMAVEGFQEAFIQQVGQNIISERPLDEGMLESLIGGLASGGVIGGVEGQMNTRSDPTLLGTKTAEWVRENKDALYDLSEHKNPTSRKTFEELGLPRMSQDDRTTLVEISRTISSLRRFEQEKAAEARKNNPNSTLPLNAETQAQVEKVQEEVAAQDAVVEGSGINEAVVEKPEPVAETVAEPPKKTAKEKAAEGVAKLKAIREAKAPKPVETEPTVAPVASEPVVAPEVAPEAAKPVDEAVAKRKRGKKVKEVAEVQPEPIATELQPPATKETVATDVAIEDTAKAKMQGKAVKTVVKESLTTEKTSADAIVINSEADLVGYRPRYLELYGKHYDGKKLSKDEKKEFEILADEMHKFRVRQEAYTPEDLPTFSNRLEEGEIYSRVMSDTGKRRFMIRGKSIDGDGDHLFDSYYEARMTSEAQKQGDAIRDERKQGKKVAPTVKDSLTVQPTAAAPVKVETDGKVTYIAPATGKASRWVKVNGEWYQSDKSGKVKGKPLEPMKLRDALDEQLQKEQGTQSAPVKVETTPAPKKKGGGPNSKMEIPEYSVKINRDGINNGVVSWQYRSQYDEGVTKRDFNNMYDFVSDMTDKYGARFAKKLRSELEKNGKSTNRTDLDSKGRTPERLAQMDANARALREASAKEGMLPKSKQGRKATKSDNSEVALELEKLGWTLAEDNTYQKRVILEDGSSATKSIVFEGNAIVLQSGLDDDVKSKIGQTPAETATLVDELSKKTPKASGQFQGMPKQTVFNSIEVEPEGKEETVEPISRSEVIGVMRKEFPGLAIRGRGTWRRKNAQGWFDKANSLIRTNDPYSVGVISHELGHYIGELSKAMKMKMPTSVSDELVKMGARIYPDKVPVGGYKNEGWAEFIRGWLTASEEMESVCPNTLTWFNSVWMPAHPKSGTSLMKIQAAVKNLRAQTPEQAVRAFWNHKDAGILPSSLSWIRSRLNYHEWVDKYHFLLTDMQAAGIDIDVMKPGLSKEERAQAIINHPYLKATLYNKSAGRRVTEMALRGTTNLVGNESTGESLYDALDGIRGDSDRLANWKDYAVARQALEYHKRGMKSGLTDAQIEATIKKFRSPEFDSALERVTQWSRRVLHLLVENGAMTQEEFDTIEAMNPIYIKFMRRFEEESVKRGTINKGKPVKKRRGGSQDIEDPVAGMLVDAQRIIQSAQQADIARCIVLAAKNAKGGSFIAENWIVKVPAPQEATEFEAERIKRFVADVALDKMGADPDMVQEELAREWKEKLTIFRAATSFKGKDKILAIVLDGKRTYYEVKDERLFDLLDGYSKPSDSSDFKKVRGKIVNTIRFGATMLSPTFGLLNNPARDTMTSFLFSDYHTHIPVVSLLHGVAIDLLGTDTSQAYHAMGLDLDTLSGRDLRSAKHLKRQVEAANTFKRDMKGGVVHTVASILSHSEVGPRIMEFRGAHNTWMDKTGSDEAASIMSGLASADMTVNFRRSGRTGGEVTQDVLFFNAGIQSVDKLLRELGIVKALPWEVQQNRGKRLLRTLGRAGLSLTLTSLISYLKYRDEDWWKEMKGYEKWGKMHWVIFGKKVHIPLPFEPGLLFGALPISILEESRTPGSIRECLGVMIDSLPIQVGGFHDLVRNITAIAPIADVMANKTWSGSDILPEHVKRTLQPVDWASSNTGETAKFLGEQIWKAVEGTRFEEMAAPAYIEYIMNQYSGGIYKRLAGTAENIKDRSAIGAGGDLSTIPLLGTFFMREGSSKLSSEFYDRIEELNRAYGSKKITLEDFGELRAKQGVAGDLTDMFDRQRKVMKDALKNRGEIKVETDKIINDILDKIREHNKNKEHFRTLGIRSAVMGITEPSALRESRVYLASLLKDVSLSEAQQQLTTQSLLLGRKTSGDAFRERIMLLNDYMQQAQE